MTLDARNSEKHAPEKNIETKIQGLISGIHKEFRLSKDTLQSLLEFKQKKWKQAITQDTALFFQELLQQVEKQSQNGEIQTSLGQPLDASHSALLTQKLIDISELTQYVQAEIEELKLWLSSEKETENLFSPTAWALTLTQNFYSPETLGKIQAPKTITDNLVWFGIWFIETLAVSGKLILDTCYGILKFPIDITRIIYHYVASEKK